MVKMTPATSMSVTRRIHWGGIVGGCHRLSLLLFIVLVCVTITINYVITLVDVDPKDQADLLQKSLATNNPLRYFDFTQPAPCEKFKCFFQSKNQTDVRYIVGQEKNMMQRLKKSWDYARHLEDKHNIKHFLLEPPKTITEDKDKLVGTMNHLAYHIEEKKEDEDLTPFCVVGSNPECKSLVVQKVRKVPSGAFLVHAATYLTRTLIEWEESSWADTVKDKRSFASKLGIEIQNLSKLLGQEREFFCNFQVFLDQDGTLYHYNVDRIIECQILGSQKGKLAFQEWAKNMQKDSIWLLQFLKQSVILTSHNKVGNKKCLSKSHNQPGTPEEPLQTSNDIQQLLSLSDAIAALAANNPLRDFDFTQPAPCGKSKCFFQSKNQTDVGYLVGQRKDMMWTLKKGWDYARHLQQKYDIKHFLLEPPKAITEGTDRVVGTMNHLAHHSCIGCKKDEDLTPFCVVGSNPECKNLVVQKVRKVPSGAFLLHEIFSFHEWEKSSWADMVKDKRAFASKLDIEIKSLSKLMDQEPEFWADFQVFVGQDGTLHHCDFDRVVWGGVLKVKRTQQAFRNGLRA